MQWLRVPLSWPMTTLLALALLLLLPPGLAAPAAAAMVSVNRPEINLRNGPGTRHAAEWTLARGYPLRVVGRRAGWLKVRDFEGDTGWVLGRLTARTPHMVVKVGVANLRSGPGVQRRLVGRAVYGEVLRTLGRRGDWVRVRSMDGLTGWVSRRLVWGW